MSYICIKHISLHQIDKKTSYLYLGLNNTYSKTCVKRPLSKRPKIGFQDQLLLKAGQKYCRMLQEEHAAILSTFIKIFVLSISEWPFYTSFTISSSEISTDKMNGILPRMPATMRITEMN